MDHGAPGLLRRSRGLQRNQTRSHPDGVARGIPGSPGLATATFCVRAPSNGCCHTLLSSGRLPHEEHPFLPALRILHPAKLLLSSPGTPTTASTIAASAGWGHARNAD